MKSIITDKLFSALLCSKNEIANFNFRTWYRTEFWWNKKAPSKFTETESKHPFSHVYNLIIKICHPKNLTFFTVKKTNHRRRRQRHKQKRHKKKGKRRRTHKTRSKPKSRHQATKINTFFKT